MRTGSPGHETSIQIQQQTLGVVSGGTGVAAATGLGAAAGLAPNNVYWLRDGSLHPPVQFGILEPATQRPAGAAAGGHARILRASI